MSDPESVRADPPVNEWERDAALRHLAWLVRERPDPARFDEDVLPVLRNLSEAQRALIFGAWDKLLRDASWDGPS